MADALRASLRLNGQESETWILTRVGEKAKGVVLVVEPVDSGSPADSPTGSPTRPGDGASSDD